MRGVGSIKIGIYIYVFTEEVGVAGNYCAVLIQRRKHKVSLL